MTDPNESMVQPDSDQVSESEQETSDDHFSDASEGAQLGKDRAPKSHVNQIAQRFEHEPLSGTRADEVQMAEAGPDKPLNMSSNSKEEDLQDVTSGTANAIDEFDEFDEFEGGDQDSDFGAFDDGTTEIGHYPEENYPQSSFTSLLPALTYKNCNTREEVVDACGPYIDNLFSNLEFLKGQQAPLDVNPSLLNERSQSLWAQLVAPPPLQPPNWVRSRIRRLFLVSLGVPVDLDEILPASKQKKLILPSTELGAGPAAITSLVQSGDITRLKNNDGSNVSVNSQGLKSDKRRRGAAAAPDFDLNAARLICTKTETALQNFTDAELTAHIGELEQLKHKASEFLQYWLVQRDSAIGDKDAFEEVIENLVKHAKKIRK